MSHRRSALSRSALVYLGALLVTAAVALGLGFVFKASSPAPPGRVLATGQAVWDEERPSLIAEVYPLPESPSVAEWEAAIPTLEKAVATKPEDARAQRQLALAYYNTGRFQDARALYEKLLAAKEDAVLRNRLGNVLRDLGDLEGAESCYRRAINQSPELSDPYMNLAELMWRRHRDGEAVALLEEGLLKVSAESRPVLERALEIIENGVPPATTTRPASTTTGTS